MGTYYQIACDDLKERIDPGNINDLGIKAASIAHPEHPFGQIVVFVMLRRWSQQHVRIVDDLSDDPGYWDYTEVTNEVLSEYNDYYGTSLKFTGETI